MSTRQLAEQHGCSKHAVETLLHRAGITMRNQPLTADQVRQAVALHDEGQSTYHIAEHFGVVQSTVWRAIKLHSGSALLEDRRKEQPLRKIWDPDGQVAGRS